MRAKKPAPKKKSAKGKPATSERALTPWQKLTADPDAALEAISQLIEDGDTITAIAQKFAVDKATVSRWLNDDPQRSAHAREARAKSAQAWDEKALEGIEQAEDAFELAKAKERAHHLRWRASKINPREYGDKIDVKQEVSFHNLTDEQINAELVRINERLASVTGSGSGASPS